MLYGFFKFTKSNKRDSRLYVKKIFCLLSHQEVEPHPAWHSSTAADWSHYNALPDHYWHTHTQTDRRQTYREHTKEKDSSQHSSQRQSSGKRLESLRVNMQMNILMKQTCADWVGPRSVSLLCLSGKTKGHNRATVFLRVSIGDNFYLPIKGWGLQGQTEVNGGLRTGCCISACFCLTITC